MSSIFAKSNRHKIFLICGNLDDMFMMGDLQKNSFRPFLNAHLKGLGFKRIVYYSGARNVGKYVLDAESALLAINANRGAADNTGAPAAAAPAKKRRILSPRAVQSASLGTSGVVASGSSPESAKDADGGKPGGAEPEPTARKLIYKQPKITPAEFLGEAKAIMQDSECQSALVFTFLRDFVNDRGGSLQPYLELLSYLWDEYSHFWNRNICIFLAPSLKCCDVFELFGRIEGGEILKNKFFNPDGAAKKSTTMEIGLPGSDEIGYLLEHMRVIGVNSGGSVRRLSFQQAEKERIISNIMFLSIEAEQREQGAGQLRDIHDRITGYISGAKSNAARLTEKSARIIYSDCQGALEANPLEKLRTTGGWESVYRRVSEILKDCERKRTAHEAEFGTVGAAPELQWGNERINEHKDSGGYRYKIPHFILRGNPGVGKTTVARLVGQIFFDAKILEKGHTVEVAAHDLVSQYVRETGIKTEECVNRALGGVLFIDDAYSLLDKSEEHNHSQEAIDALVQILTRKNVRFCLIMAGYPEPMDELLDMNPGFRGRFSRENILTIDDYSPEILKNIFVSTCQKNGYSFSAHAGAGKNIDLDLFFSNMYKQRNRRTFGNARDVVDLADSVMAKSSLRDDETNVIEIEDFGAAAAYFTQRDISSIDEIYMEIDKYVGLEFIKELFENVRFEILDARESARRGAKVDSSPDHYIFSGNPGTGKTTVGRMMGQFYHLMGELGGAETLFADASDLTGTHYGDAKTKVLEKIQEAIDKNQVLYIDEAYQIIDSGYAQETIGAMMTKMTENARDFKMIFGLYPDRVEEFLKLNSGLERRLRIVEFPDYTPPQLLEIFVRSVSEQCCTITDETLHRVSLILERMYDVRTQSFGNAGTVKKFLADMKRARLRRTFNFDQSDDRKYEYSIEDIPADALKSVQDLLNPRSLDDIMKELNEMIGLSAIKEIIIKKQREMEYARRFGEDTESVRPGYYFFVGNPGTGKTTGAKLFAECLHRIGVVKTDRVKYATAKDFTGRYVGETDKKTYDLLKSSLNGTLFIDEAYSLSYADDVSGGGFKKEALEEIIAFLEDDDNRKRCCVIFAGYPREMRDFYRSNSGLRSRGEEVRFDDYSPEEVYEIFALFCRRKGYSLPDDAKERYMPVIERMAGSKYFANARTARTIFEKTEQNMKNRLASSRDASPDDAGKILTSDLLNPEEMMEIAGEDPK
ncbi:MAG: AAA family ATPase [Synergistaceae bacterium]|jgi:SpoVK/Ycf46/Vps4 family AAA+-type ATPase|nr:AAA family ATPase [Synergistaceae bacterium]